MSPIINHFSFLCFNGITKPNARTSKIVLIAITIPSQPPSKVMILVSVIKCITRIVIKRYVVAFNLPASFSYFIFIIRN